MKVNRASLLLVLFAVVVGAQPVRGQNRPDPLEIRLRDMPIDFQGAALSGALDRIAFFASSDFVLIGAEVQTIDGREPLISVHIEGGRTVRQALMELTAKVPEYSFEAVAPHLVNVFPAAARNDPNDLLNLKAGDVRLRMVLLTNFLGNPARFIPELKMALSGGHPGCAIGPGLADTGPEVDIAIKGGTVREELNEVSEFSASLAEEGKAEAYGWAYLHELLPSPTHPANQWRVLTSWNPAQRGKGASPK
jgi:hypothetical protein